MCRDVKAPVLDVENQQRSIHKTLDALKPFIGDAENRWIHGNSIHKNYFKLCLSVNFSF